MLERIEEKLGPYEIGLLVFLNLEDAAHGKKAMSLGRIGKNYGAYGGKILQNVLKMLIEYNFVNETEQGYQLNQRTDKTIEENLNYLVETYSCYSLYA